MPDFDPNASDRAFLEEVLELVVLLKLTAAHVERGVRARLDVAADPEPSRRGVVLQLVKEACDG